MNQPKLGIYEALKKELRKVLEKLWFASIMGIDEEITGVVEEVCVEGNLRELDNILDTDEKSTWVIPVESVEMYGVIVGMCYEHKRNLPLGSSI